MELLYNDMKCYNLRDEEYILKCYFLEIFYSNIPQ